MKLTLEGRGFEGETLLQKKDGTTFFVNLSTILYKGDLPNLELIIFTMQDITHLKKMEKGYLGSERFAGLGMMTDQISHQIRNPIVSIGGFALRLLREQVSKGEYFEYSKIIHNEAKRLEYIIDRLVEFAQVHPSKYSAITLSDFFEGLKNNLKIKLEDNPSIIFPDEKTLPVAPLFGDCALLIRAVQCVVQNSLEAIKDDGKIFLAGDIIDSQVIIKVKDNGEGISPEKIPFIFDPFFTTKFNYLGLGLTMAKRIVEEHKGRIEVVSAPGEGTEVTIILPQERRREIRRRLI